MERQGGDKSRNQVVQSIEFESEGAMEEARILREVVERVVLPSASERDKAVALHDYVRDTVKFGFCKYFDNPPIEYLLSYRYGHCNPKTSLMVELFRAAGFEAHRHYVVIPNEILLGAINPSRYWMLPKELSHSYTEVLVNGKWCSIDSYIIDTPLLRGGLAKLASENRAIGYGVRTGAVNTWDGQSDAFSQFDRGMMIEDHGRIEDLEAFFHDSKYRHVMLGLRFNTLFPMLGEFGVKPMNAHIDKIRL